MQIWFIKKINTNKNLDDFILSSDISTNMMYFYFPRDGDKRPNQGRKENPSIFSFTIRLLKRKLLCFMEFVPSIPSFCLLFFFLKKENPSFCHVCQYGGHCSALQHGLPSRATSLHRVATIFKLPDSLFLRICHVGPALWLYFPTTTVTDDHPSCYSVIERDDTFCNPPQVPSLKRRVPT